MSQIITKIRNASLDEIMAVLKDQQARQQDVIVNAGDITYDHGNLVIASGPNSQILTDDGVTDIAGSYLPTEVGDESMAGRLDAHGGWIKAVRAKGRYDILDGTFNALLHGGGDLDFETNDPEFGPFDRTVMLRLLKGDPGEAGVLRAALSGKYKIMDNLTVLMAVMAGIQRAGVEAVPSDFDLSERRLFGRFDVPGLAQMAPDLLKGYRSPWEGAGAPKRAGDDRPGYRFRSEYGNWSVDQALRAAHAEGQGYPEGQEPVVWAGIVVSNSDVGGGSRTISPQIRVRICKNGLTLIAEQDRKIHLGVEQGVGVMEWSDDTQRAELDLITKQTADLVATWMTPEWFGGQVAKIEALAGVPIAEPAPVMKAVAQSVKFTRAEEASILEHFLRGGLYTSGGVAQAVTVHSQTIADADRAAWLDQQAVPAMAAAAKAAA
jgi:hypothetical protein